MASRRSSPRRSRCASRRSGVTRQQPSSAACRRRAPTTWPPAWARTSTDKIPNGTLGTWMIDQWKQIGVAVDQKMEATGPFYATLENGAFDVALEFNCQSIVNPLVDTSKFRPDAGDQYGGFTDPELIKLYDAMNQTGDEVEAEKRMGG